MTVCLAVVLLLSLVAAAAATNQCYDDCYERKRCEGYHSSSSSRRRCKERCERFCGIQSEDEKDTRTEERLIPGQSDVIAHSADVGNGIHLQANATCCNFTSVTWPKNATFDDLTAKNVTVQTLSADGLTVAGGVHAKATISSRIYAEDVAASGFVTAETLLVKDHASFRNRINATAIAAEAFEATSAVTDQLQSSTAHVTGTLTAGKIEIKINGKVTDLAREFSSLQQRVKGLEEVLLSSEGIQACPKQKESDLIDAT